MKKITLLCSVFASAYLSAQTFSDNFDSYTAGQLLAQNSGGAWTTWSNAPGGAEDVAVSSANAVSMPNSVYFSSDLDGGGPTDLVKHFGLLNTGSFSMEMNMFVQNGKAAYFNFQKTATMGQTWAMDCNFNDDGTMVINNQSGLNFTANFTHAVWFNFRIDINFNTNHWEVFIDDVSQGSFANPENQIESIDIFPVDQVTPFSSGFFIDDFQYTVTPYTLPTLNASANLVSFTGGNIAGVDVLRKVKVRNLGLTAITSFDITCNYNGVNTSQSFTGLNLASLAEIEVNITQPMTLVAGAHLLTATVSNVNGNATDGDANDNVASLNIDPVVPAVGKMVVGEEGTGTWCGWCPRGAVFMDKMEDTYHDYWAGIAVHNGDPMVVTVYDSVMGTLIGGYPTALVDRGAEIDPSDIEVDFLERIAIAPTALISNTATWNSSTRLLTVTVSAEFLSSANNNYKMLCVLTEDGVSGTTSDYSQTNYYSGGSNGVMGGFEALANPVPAAQMTYDHVARAIAPSFGGTSTGLPATINSGETHSMVFNFILPASWNEHNMNIIGMLVAPNGQIDNAGKVSISSALSVPELNKEVDNHLAIYPNPAANYLDYSYSNGSVKELKILAADGKVVWSKKSGDSLGKIDLSLIEAGVYFVEIIGENGSAKEMFIKQ